MKSRLKLFSPRNKTCILSRRIEYFNKEILYLINRNLVFYQKEILYFIIKRWFHQTLTHYYVFTFLLRDCQVWHYFRRDFIVVSLALIVNHFAPISFKFHPGLHGFEIPWLKIGAKRPETHV